ncbi:MAG TPA: hypothetical protein VLI05_01440 [Candidatus Saccharimonadia bacterium]|nr:hypothetical protein [Candidatus Saccharimonadia bacterium]
MSIARAILTTFVDDMGYKLQAWTLAQEKAPGSSGVWLSPGQAVPKACAFLLNSQAILTATA